ncbi:Os10g0361850 [Oryza sativa Japonica Group]|uniref:Os10g0361850 protein n=2 Tax=Oryza sativa subsp. japonica TaxID=39947 RepID=Q339E3_ORYSJ|nr:hypothetical protein LOC_Os10g21780 [Oryza sativa Japonica Group]EAZ15809.1 hypothetical protein OsJ_31228 [Oryza sativa Japonica Group]BAT10507.1 Os10g0361850 [Oryza sativa Japonica Group]
MAGILGLAYNSVLRGPRVECRSGGLGSLFCSGSAWEGRRTTSWRVDDGSDGTKEDRCLLQHWSGEDWLREGGGNVRIDDGNTLLIVVAASMAMPLHSHAQHHYSLTSSLHHL